ncbi:hypothetical protein TNCV_2791531 [Trichonephila clavipes]|nr:hypothetical protein TNCV_2791531 [Trichonephila clavipes]
MPSEQWKISPRKGKHLQIPLEYLKMRNKFLCKFRPVCDSGLTAIIFLPDLQERHLDNVRLQQDRDTSYTSRASMGILRAAAFPERGHKLACVITC